MSNGEVTTYRVVATDQAQATRIAENLHELGGHELGPVVSAAYRVSPQSAKLDNTMRAAARAGPGAT
jgi:hypothetical protein